MTRFFRKKEKGVTLVEILIVIAIMGILIGIGSVGFFSFKKGTDFSLSAEKVVNAIRLAEMKARNGTQDDGWGVDITESRVIVFKGSVFITRNVSYDETLDLSGVMSVSGTTQFLFSKMSGLPTGAGTITLQGADQNKTIQINEKGVVSE